MHTISTAVASILVMLVMAGCSQPTGVAAAADAMGATTLNSIEYSGSGSTFAFGQAPSPGARWPRFEAKTYNVAVDYQAPAMRLDIVRAQGEHPPLGGGGAAASGRAANRAGRQRHACVDRGGRPAGAQPGCGQRAAPAALAHAAWRNQGRGCERRHR